MVKNIIGEIKSNMEENSLIQLEKPEIVEKVGNVVESEEENPQDSEGEKS